MSGTRATATSAALILLLSAGAALFLFVDLSQTSVILNSIRWEGYPPYVGLKPSTSQQCPQPVYTPPSNASEYFDSDEYRHLALTRLTKAISYPTISYDDFGEPEPAAGQPRDPRWDVFDDLHAFLEQTYPLTYARAAVEKVGGYSLIFALPGSTSAKPIMLTGHQDVVGVGSEADWRYPPFSGHFDGDYIWGRGSSDCKSNVIGLLSVMEKLIETGFEPKRTIILAFGQDEEASGVYGADRIAKRLVEQYGQNGIELILDEGGLGLDTRFGPLMALPALAEKGYVDVGFRLTAGGGHSSLPPEHTSIGLLAHILTTLEDNALFEPVLEKSNPHYAYLECVVAHGQRNLVPSWLGKGLRGDLSAVARKVATEWGDSERYLLQTTKAVTRIGGGIKNNVLPEEAYMLINSRLQISTTVADHLDAMEEAVYPLVDRYDLSLTAFGKEIRNGSAGHLTLYTEHTSDPVSSTSWQSEIWHAFASAIRSTFGPDTIAAPTLSTSNTDTRHYLEVSNNIFRWTPARTGTRLNAHGTNERMKLSTHMEASKFYHGWEYQNSF